MVVGAPAHHGAQRLFMDGSLSTPHGVAPRGGSQRKILKPHHGAQHLPGGKAMFPKYKNVKLINVYYVDLFAASR